MSLQVTVYRCGICEDYNFDQSIMCKRHMTEKHYGWRCQECRIVFARQLPRHKNCQGELELINRTTMTCTREEKEAYEGFQRNRGDKVILVRMSWYHIIQFNSGEPEFPMKITNLSQITDILDKIRLNQIHFDMNGYQTHS